MMVAPEVLRVVPAFVHGRAPELPAPHHECLLQQPALLQVLDEGGRRLVGLLAARSTDWRWTGRPGTLSARWAVPAMPTFSGSAASSSTAGTMATGGETWIRQPGCARVAQRGRARTHPPTTVARSPQAARYGARAVETPTAPAFRSTSRATRSRYAPRPWRGSSPASARAASKTSDRRIRNRARRPATANASTTSRAAATSNPCLDEPSCNHRRDRQ
jgi:hypothetical protein